MRHLRADRADGAAAFRRGARERTWAETEPRPFLGHGRMGRGWPGSSGDAPTLIRESRPGTLLRPDSFQFANAARAHALSTWRFSRIQKRMGGCPLRGD